MPDGFPEHYHLFRPLEAIRRAVGHFTTHCALNPTPNHSEHWRGAERVLDNELYGQVHEPADGEAWNSDPNPAA